ncbi:MAG: ferrochelatase [Parvularculaceae bacterium]
MTTPDGPSYRPACDNRPADHPVLPLAKTGVLLVNLGTPEAPTASAVRAYLGEFLSDPRVVDLPRALWLPILHGVILNVRPAKSARAYQKIWTDEGSPLKSFTRRASEALAARVGDKAIIDWAMRYGAPSVRGKIDAMREAGADRIVVIPLYPQYSRSTTASVADAAEAAVASLPWRPATRIAAPFHDHPKYIGALQSSAERHLSALGWKPEKIILSFHGTPKRWLGEGEPYYCHCAKTARLLREAMGWSEDFAPLAFQSRFGREEWLGPATDALIRENAQKGARNLAVMTPGFLADCLETLEEIAIGGAETFHEAGGENFAAIPCLNDDAALIDLLETLVHTEAAGWI